jgi:hypothetical protein
MTRPLQIIIEALEFEIQKHKDGLGYSEQDAKAFEFMIAKITQIGNGNGYYINPSAYFETKESLLGSYQTEGFITMRHDYERRLNHSQLGNYPYPVDQSTCNHIFAPVEEKGNFSGPWKARCQKCGYEP